jgi:hypothetical protein
MFVFPCLHYPRTKRDGGASNSLVHIELRSQSAPFLVLALLPICHPPALQGALSSDRSLHGAKGWRPRELLLWGAISGRRRRHGGVLSRQAAFRGLRRAAALRRAVHLWFLNLSIYLIDFARDSCDRAAHLWFLDLSIYLLGFARGGRLGVWASRGRAREGQGGAVRHAACGGRRGAALAPAARTPATLPLLLPTSLAQLSASGSRRSPRRCHGAPPRNKVMEAASSEGWIWRAISCAWGPRAGSGCASIWATTSTTLVVHLFRLWERDDPVESWGDGGAFGSR